MSGLVAKGKRQLTVQCNFERGWATMVLKPKSVGVLRATIVSNRKVTVNGGYVCLGLGHRLLAAATTGP